MEIKKVACVGAGLIGHSWATLFAMRGFPVNLYDVKEEILNQALEKIKSGLNFLGEKELMKREDVEPAFERIKPTTNLSEAVGDVQYVQESVFEKYEVKKSVFKQMDEQAPADTILASSTSTLLMTEIQKVTKKPERCLIAHPFNPPHLIPLVELVPGEQTSQKMIETTYELMLKLKKVPVVLKKEVTGFIVNRVAFALYREVIDLVDKGIASVEDVDKAVYAGPGIRWAIAGSNLIYHLGGGEGGLKYFLDHLGPVIETVLESEETWTRLPYSGVKKVIEGVKQTELVKAKSREELVRWRDDKLVELLKILYG